MQHPSTGNRNQELYRAFIEFVRGEIQRERSAVNRRMLSVFFWCFLLPAMVSATILVLVKVDVLSRSARAYLDWLPLVFPILYSLYFLGAEVLRDLPAAFRRGGISNLLTQAIRDGEWRQQVCDGMARAVQATPEEWKWIEASFETDLRGLLQRARYLTVLAGAVFFLLMRGIDVISDPVGAEADAWVDAGADFSELAGLGLFLILLYLSGSQPYHTLKKYLDCAELRRIAGQESQQRR